MRDIIDELHRWSSTGVEFTIATVTRTWDSSPRPAGSSMALSETGAIIGSVSGGCVEGALIELSREVLADGRSRTARYGTEETDFSVGLACGGSIQVVVHRADDHLRGLLEDLHAAVRGHRTCALATRIPIADTDDEPGPHHLFIDPSAATDRSLTGSPFLDANLRDQALALISDGGTELVRLSGALEKTFLVEAHRPSPRMLIFGAVDFAVALSRMGTFLGYHVTVCDARAPFATAERFPAADEIVVDWPHRYLDRTETDDHTVICVLTHDPKFDVPLLVRALRRPARYIGALGSRRTHEDRAIRLRHEGLSEQELTRLRSPIGLDLRGLSPEETAVSIAAEIVALHRGGSGLPLSRTTASIHGSTD
ncbi:XdhC family protein [Austwickia chelonae]|uniref:XdhC family protein n=1 Tax=Austwickia chelonae TaxID=100225 RepID=UPI000E271FE7|nr:XdhC family protein [Austwickia chelonae]